MPKRFASTLPPPPIGEAPPLGEPPAPPVPHLRVEGLLGRAKKMGGRAPQLHLRDFTPHGKHSPAGAIQRAPITRQMAQRQQLQQQAAATKPAPAPGIAASAAQGAAGAAAERAVKTAKLRREEERQQQAPQAAPPTRPFVSRQRVQRLTPEQGAEYERKARAPKAPPNQRRRVVPLTVKEQTRRANEDRARREAGEPMPKPIQKMRAARERSQSTLDALRQHAAPYAPNEPRRVTEPLETATETPPAPPLAPRPAGRVPGSLGAVREAKPAPPTVSQGKPRPLGEAAPTTPERTATQEEVQALKEQQNLRQLGKDYRELRRSATYYRDNDLPKLADQADARAEEVKAAIKAGQPMRKRRGYRASEPEKETGK